MERSTASKMNEWCLSNQGCAYLKWYASMHSLNRKYMWLLSCTWSCSWAAMSGGGGALTFLSRRSRLWRRWSKWIAAFPDWSSKIKILLKCLYCEVSLSTLKSTIQIKCISIALWNDANTNIINKSYFLNRLFWISSNMATSVFSASASGIVTFSPVSLLTATHWRCCISLGPTSRRIGTPWQRKSQRWS